MKEAIQRVISILWIGSGALLVYNLIQCNIESSFMFGGIHYGSQLLFSVTNEW